MNILFRPAVNVAALFNGMTVAAESKDFMVRQATTNILKSILGGKNL